MKIKTKDVSYNAEVIESDDFTSIFCDNWELAKAALEKLKEAIKNPIVKFIIGIVIDAGQATYDKTCGK